MTYGKLVRDKIPDEIKERGNTPVIHTAEDQEYFSALINKVKEEANELAVASYTRKEEMADVLEVVYAIREYLNLDPEEIEQIRQTKRNKKGGFEKRIILEEVN